MPSTLHRHYRSKFGPIRRVNKFLQHSRPSSACTISPSPCLLCAFLPRGPWETLRMADLLSVRLSYSMLGAILLRPSLSFASSSRASQQRLSSGVSRLTKLHRKQKVALREERMLLHEPPLARRYLHPLTQLPQRQAQQNPLLRRDPI